MSNFLNKVGLYTKKDLQNEVYIATNDLEDFYEQSLKIIKDEFSKKTNEKDKEINSLKEQLSKSNIDNRNLNSKVNNLLKGTSELQEVNIALAEKNDELNTEKLNLLTELDGASNKVKLYQSKFGAERKEVNKYKNLSRHLLSIILGEKRTIDSDSKAFFQKKYKELKKELDKIKK